MDGGPADTVLGIPTATPIKRKAPLQTLNLMSITSPAEGESVTSTFTASGANNGFESWVGWQLLKDGKVVKKGFGTARGWAANRLFPWKVKVDASGLPAGDYVLRLYNDDPTGGTEAADPTRTPGPSSSRDSLRVVTTRLGSCSSPRATSTAPCWLANTCSSVRRVRCRRWSST